MKTTIVSFLLFLSPIVTTGCATVLGAAVGGAVDKSLGGNGNAGMLAGAALGSMIGKAHADKKITVGEDKTIAMRCQNRYSYSTNGRPAVMSKDCAGASIERMPTNGFPSAPTPSYGLGTDEQATSATTPPCHRYNTDGTINADCR